MQRRKILLRGSSIDKGIGIIIIIFLKAIYYSLISHPPFPKKLGWEEAIHLFIRTLRSTAIFW